MDNLADKLATGAMLVAVFLLGPVVAVGIYWLLWQLWTFVMPQIWSSGPASFTSPDFWPFAGFWFLLTIVLRMVRGKAA